MPDLAGEFLKAEATLAEVDVKVLGDKRTSELGRFAVTRGFDDLGSFKTPTLRNIAVTAPYMHDGSLARRCATWWSTTTTAASPTRAIRSTTSSAAASGPSNLTDEQIDDLVAFMEALTSPEFARLRRSHDHGQEGVRP